MPGVASNTALTEFGQKRRKLAERRPSEQQAISSISSGSEAVDKWEPPSDP